jgi:hypothetical protein
VIEVFTAAAVLVAWFVFRYDRAGKRHDAIEAAYGVLSAVHYGMVQGLSPGQAVGWGQLYFFNEYDPAGAEERAEQTRFAIAGAALDQVFVVPTEPLAKLATTTPQEGLIETRTVAIANFALWRVRVFNQLVRQLTDFNTQHAVEIMSDETDPTRRAELAEAGRRLSMMIHLQGIGQSWSMLPGGGRGWYGELVARIGANMTDLTVQRNVPRWRRHLDVPYVLVDGAVLVGVVAVVVAVV